MTATVCFIFAIAAWGLTIVLQLVTFWCEREPEPEFDFKGRDMKGLIT